MSPQAQAFIFFPDKPFSKCRTERCPSSRKGGGQYTFLNTDRIIHVFIRNRNASKTSKTASSKRKQVRGKTSFSSVPEKKASV